MMHGQDQEAAEYVHYKHIFFIATRDSNKSEWILSFRYTLKLMQIVSWHRAKVRPYEWFCCV